MERTNAAPKKRTYRTATKIPQLLFFSLTLVSFAASQTSVERPRTIRVVLDNAYAPYSFQSDDGQLNGILIDQWNAWEKKTGIKAELHAMDWGEALRRMRAGEFDVIDSIVATAERREYFDFTPAYTAIEASIYFRKDISGISGLASLKGFPIGVKTGDQHIDQLKANGVTTVILFQNNDAIIQAAKEHKINVFVVDDPSALYLLNKMGIEEEFRHSAPIFRDELRRAVRKGDVARLSTISEGFAAIDPGELKRIDEKWFGQTINRYGRYLTYAAYAAAIAILIIGGLFAWNRTLRKRILQRTALLHAREQEFRAIVENAPDQIIRYDKEFRRAYINPAVARAYGLPREALIGKPVGSVIEDAGLDVTEDELTQLRQKIADVFNSGRSYEYELNWLLPAGRRYFSVRLFPELDLNGSVVNVLGISRDITQHKQAEEALEERLRFETLVTELSAAFANLPPHEVDREIDKCLQTLAEFLGVDRASFFQFGEDRATLYRSHSYTVPGIKPLPSPPIGLKDQFPWIMDQLSQGVTVKWSRIPDDMPEEAVNEKEYAARLGAKSGLNIPVLIGGSVICAITFTSIVTYRDWPDALVARLRLVGEIFAAAAERKHAEEQLRGSNDQLRAVSARLHSAREEESIRIAREIHDELGSMLTALKWDVEEIQKTLSTPVGQSQLAAARQKLAALTKLTDMSVTTLRRIASELRPSVLDDLGLAAAIEWQAQQFQARTGIISDCDCSLENIELSAEQSTAVFRVFQEALTNVLRHAQATRVDIEIKKEKSHFVLSVSDNGKGISNGARSEQQTLGLLGMRERAHLVGGEVTITSAAGQGTVVTLRLPITGLDLVQRMTH